MKRRQAARMANKPTPRRSALPAAIDPTAVADARASALSAEMLSLVVSPFQALAVTTRARILYALTQRPLCVRDLAIIAGVSESAISHHRGLLRERSLVKSRRTGTVIYYTVANPHVAALFREGEYHADHIRQNLPDNPYPRESIRH